ncbi:hypothetical protein C8Q80DRAFT_1180184 [Daedaleopsis nitida]|nr:hypothetical protein C8Q80DRAFT_1180184 [Daedaleopsis nitida]
MSNSTAQSNTETPGYLVRTSELPPDAFQRIDHFIAPDCHRLQARLGNLTGLTRTGVHLYRLPAGTTSMALHWHERVDDWMFILDGGEGGKLLVWEPQGEKSKAEIVPTEVEVKNGDFLGFRAGVERAHALKAGATEMVYLVGGSREPVDVCHYPKEGKRTDIEVDMTTGKWKGDTKDEDRLATSN